MNISKGMREQAAQDMLRDIVWLLKGTMENADIERYRNPRPELEGTRLVELLERNFARLDPDNNGISREEMVAALMNPGRFSEDEYAMLTLLSTFFETVINMSDDEPGPETVITKTDGQVMAQFLEHGHLTLSELHRWIAIKDNKATEKDIGPPPLSGAV